MPVKKKKPVKNTSKAKKKPASKEALQKLSKYRSMRDFAVTAEPAGGSASPGKGRSYLIQKHAARRLHYDFRIEMDGVLKSWAVTRGPSLSHGDKRLAVHVEDHPLEYGGFEGIIPHGQYGGGTVMLWDQGEWEPLGDPQKEYKKGHLRFRLHGKRLTGEWMLVRMKSRNPRDKHENWLLIKGHGEGEKPEDGEYAVREHITSITTGRTMEEIAGQKTNVWQSNQSVKKNIASGATKTKKKPVRSAASKKRPLGNAALPEFVSPALATLVSAPPRGERWLHEIKFDGYRTLARLDNGKIKLLTRTGLDWTRKFTSIATALKALDATRAFLDGEIVHVGEGGQMSFGALQESLSAGRDDRLHYYVFDLLHLDGEDLTKRPLEERKARLRALLPVEDARLHFSEHFEATGEAMLEQACNMRLEGIVSKRSDAPYRSGRGKDWLKSKCVHEQEVVIGGFTYQSNASRQLGALLVGVYAKEKLLLSGKVGTGFSQDEARRLLKKLEALEIKHPPFEKFDSAYRRGAHWVKPELVAQIQYGEWTSSGILRHASYQGLREDKPASEINREKEVAPPNEIKATKSDTPVQKDQGGSKSRTVVPETARRSIPKRGETLIAGVKLTHPDKVLYPDQGITKQALAEYYEAVADWMLPHIAERPLSLVRCPEGSGKACFFQRHTGKGISPHIYAVPDEREGDRPNYLMVKDASGLIALVQMGVLEIHAWGSHETAIEKADLLVFDFDPEEGLSFDMVREAALEMKARLEKLDLKSFVKTTGGKGLHVVTPIQPQAEWPVIKAFCRAMSELMANDFPDRYTINPRKAERKGRIFIDYLRNDRTSTAIAPYSSRARPGAPVAMPLAWSDLKTFDVTKPYTIETAPAHLKQRKRDPWKDILTLKQKLPRFGK